MIAYDKWTLLTSIFKPLLFNPIYQSLTRSMIYIFAIQFTTVIYKNNLYKQGWFFFTVQGLILFNRCKTSFDYLSKYCAHLPFALCALNYSKRVRCNCIFVFIYEKHNLLVSNRNFWSLNVPSTSQNLFHMQNM